MFYGHLPLAQLIIFAVWNLFMTGVYIRT